MNARSIALFGALFGLAVVSCGDECDVPGEKWCEGGVRYWCRGGGEGSSFGVSTELHEETCDLACIERDDDAACVIAQEPCPAGAEKVCIGNILASCEEVGYPVEWKDCSLEWGDDHCVELADGTNAACAYSSEPCANDGDEMCSTDVLGAWWLCSDGVWNIEEHCEPGGVCVQTSSTEVICE